MTPRNTPTKGPTPTAPIKDSRMKQSTRHTIADTIGTTVLVVLLGGPTVGCLSYLGYHAWLHPVVAGGIAGASLALGGGFYCLEALGQFWKGAPGPISRWIERGAPDDT